MKKILLHNVEYELMEDYKNGFDFELILSKCNDLDYFDSYDYILGDWSYGKIRLKGFCNKENTIYNSTNNYEKIHEYIENYCAYECKYFVLKKL